MAIQDLITPVGRVVWGHPGKSQTKKDQQTKQVVMKDGKPVEQWAFGVAFQKAEFQQKVLPYLQQEAASGYPHGVPGNFSWKFKDGDSVDSAGKPYSTREGYAGCYVMTISTEAFAPPLYKQENGRYVQITADEIKTGDYVGVVMNVKVNVPTNRAHTPGLYINPSFVILAGYGQPIHNTANPEDVIGNYQFQLPPGASATPMLSNAPLPGQPMMPAAPMMPQGNGMGNVAPQGMNSPYQAVGMQGNGMMPSNNGPVAPMNAYPSNPQQPNYAQPAAPLPAPAHDFVHNAGQPMMPQQPQQYAPVQPAYPAQPAAPTGYPMPGMPQR